MSSSPQRNVLCAAKKNALFASFVYKMQHIKKR